jgi:hypothetical protein
MGSLRIAALAVAALFGLSAAVTASAQTTQQVLMKQCNIEANGKGLMGSRRRAFMRTCLRSPHRRHLALNSQQRRMRYCNEQAKAKGLMGSDRSRYVSGCLRLR